MNTESLSSNQDNPSSLAPIKDLNEIKIWQMQQDMELLQEQVKSLKQEFTHGYEYTKKCLQELEYAQQELEWMNQEISNLINSKKLPMDEVNPLASRMSKPKGVVGSTIDEFKAKSHNLRVQPAQMIDHSIQLRAESKQIKVQSDKVQARSREVREHSYEARVGLYKKRISQALLKCQIGSRLPFRAIANKRSSSEIHWLIGTGDNFHPFAITNKLVHPGRSNPPVGRGEWGRSFSEDGGVGEWGSGRASFYFNPIKVVENLCHAALEARFSRYLPDSLKTAIASLTPLAAKSDSLPVTHY